MAAKQIALKWRLLDSNQKNKYVKLFNSQNKAYEKAKRNLKLQQIKGEKVKGQKKKVHQPFVAFIKDHYTTVKSSLKEADHKQIMARLSDNWKKLSADEKNLYKEKVAA